MSEHAECVPKKPRERAGNMPQGARWVLSTNTATSRQRRSGEAVHLMGLGSGCLYTF